MNLSLRPAGRGLSLVLCAALSTSALLLVPPGPADAADPASYAVYEASPLRSTPYGPRATVLPLAKPSGFSQQTRGLQLVTDPDAGTVVLEALNLESGEMLSQVDLSSSLTTVEAAVAEINEGTDRLEVFVTGTVSGARTLVRVTSGEKEGLEGAVASVVPATSAVRLDSLQYLGESSGGFLAVHLGTDGVYRGQLVSYDLEAVGTEFALPLAAADRRFLMNGSSRNLVSVRAGAVDVVSLRDTSTLHTTEVPGLDAPTTMTISSDDLAVADADGDVALVTMQYRDAGRLVGVVRVPGGVSGLSVDGSVSELQATTTSGDRISRYALGDLGERPAFDLTGISVVPGTLRSGPWWKTGASFLARAQDSTYRYYGQVLQQAEVMPATSVSDIEARGDAPTWTIVTKGNGAIEGDWEYSLDGGASWAGRGAGWTTAVPDQGEQVVERPALQQPLDGVAPYLRQEVDVLAYMPFGFSRTEYSVGIPDVQLDALWRVRASNELGVSHSEPRRIVVTTPGDQSVQRFAQHPSVTSAALWGQASFEVQTTGSGTPVLGWQRSRDAGTTWEDVAGASAARLTLTATPEDDGALFRAALGTAETRTFSEAARLTVRSAAVPGLGAAPSGAVATLSADLTYDLSAYSHEWLRATFGKNVSAVGPTGFAFSGGTGWTSPTGETQVVWDGTAIYRPYGGLNGLHITLANPYLAVAADGRGTLTADLAWNNGGGMGGSGGSTSSDGSRRVILATFGTPTTSTTTDGTTTLRGTPDWSGRPYMKPGLDDARTYASSHPASFLDAIDDSLRPWLLSSGSSRDAEKAPLPVSVTFVAGTAAASTTGAAVDPLDPLADGRYPFADSAPTVVTQPQSQVAQAGAPVTVTAEAGGYPQPKVVWQSRSAEGTWTDIAGATTGTLVVSDLGADGVAVRAVFTNRAGRSVTETAVLSTAVPGPSEPEQPAPAEPTDPSVPPEPTDPTAPPEPGPTEPTDPDPTVPDPTVPDPTDPAEPSPVAPAPAEPTTPVTDDVPPPPVVSPVADGKDQPTVLRPLSTGSATTTPLGAPAATAVGGDVLASTGAADIGVLHVVATALLLTGGTLVVARRRRATRP